MKFFMSPESVKILGPSYFEMKFMRQFPVDLGVLLFWIEILHVTSYFEMKFGTDVT